MTVAVCPGSFWLCFLATTRWMLSSATVTTIVVPRRWAKQTGTDACANRSQRNSFPLLVIYVKWLWVTQMWETQAQWEVSQGQQTICRQSCGKQSEAHVSRVDMRQCWHLYLKTRKCCCKPSSGPSTQGPQGHSYRLVGTCDVRMSLHMTVIARACTLQFILLNQVHLTIIHLKTSTISHPIKSLPLIHWDHYLDTQKSHLNMLQ